MSTQPVSPARPPGVDLLAAAPRFARLARSRWFPLAVAVPLLVLAGLFIAAGFVGTPVGNRNGLIVFVWIFWWFALIAILLPFTARSWCGVCPLPLLGDWLQRRRLLTVVHADPRAEQRGPGVRIGRNLYRGAARRWPRAFANLWLQNLGFLFLATFSVVLLTSPLASAIALSGLAVIATLVALRYRQRSFCRFLCPVGGFLGLYSSGSTLAVRARSRSVCATCKEKSCLAGNERGWGCPWLEYPSRLARNNACGLCLECVKSCPHENMSLFVRPPFRDRKLEGWDEAFKAFLMLALAIAYTVVYLGPWGHLKAAANVGRAEWRDFALYAGGLWIFALAVVPGLYVGAAWLGRRLGGVPQLSLRSASLAGAASLVPFGLFAWIAFSVPLALANGSYVLAAASDPFGWGWDLFGTSSVPWTPVVPHWTPWLQAGLLLVGQGTGLRAGWLESRELDGDRRRALAFFAPTAVLLTGTTLLLLALHTG